MLGITALILVLMTAVVHVPGFGEAQAFRSGAMPLPAAQAAGTPGAILNLTPADMLGVQSISRSHLSQGGSTVKAAGANFIHFGIEWDDLAPATSPSDPPTYPEDYDWTDFDASLGLASSLGYEIMVTLGHNPLWAASFRRGPVDCVPLSRFTDYVSTVVTRYSASPYNVKYWAIYNEPDVTGFTRVGFTDCSGDSWAYAFGDSDYYYNGLNGPEHYVEHLEAAYSTIKSIDPDAVVMIGGVAHDFFTSEGGFFNENFLNEIFSAGAGNYMDAMNFHFYPEFDGRWESRVPGQPGLIAKTRWIRDIMSSYGLDKPMVISELGDSSGFGGDDPRSQDTQAIAVIKQFSRSLSERVKIGIWYNMNDYPGTSETFEEHGLLDYPSYEPKLSLNAYETLANALVGHRFMRSLSPTEMGATNLEGYLFWDLASSQALYILWSLDGSAQTINLPAGVSSVVDKFGNPVSYGSTLDIDEQPRLITRDLTFNLLFMPNLAR